MTVLQARKETHSYGPPTPVFVAGETCAHFAAAAIMDPTRFDQQEIDLAADSLTMVEFVQIAAVWGAKQWTAAALDHQLRLGQRGRRGIRRQLCEWLKTLRKKNASVIFATQSLSSSSGRIIGLPFHRPSIHPGGGPFFYA